MISNFNAQAAITLNTDIPARKGWILPNDEIIIITEVTDDKVYFIYHNKNHSAKIYENGKGKYIHYDELYLRLREIKEIA